jgi:hypothetical protein
MTVLKCNACGAKVESNKCCGKPMKLNDETLKCDDCGKEVEVNHCCDKAMVEEKESGCCGCE